MAESVKIWQQIPPLPFSVAAAVADPLRYLSLARWGALQQLRRGAQVGPANPGLVWCIGLYRFPTDWVMSLRDDRRRMRGAATVFINPNAMRLLLRQDGLSVARVGERLAQLDLMIPSASSCMTWPVKIPGSGFVGATPMYCVRGELGFLVGEDVPQSLRAIAAVVRVTLGGFYELNDALELRRNPDFRFVPYRGPVKMKGVAPTRLPTKSPAKANGRPKASASTHIGQQQLL